MKFENQFVVAYNEEKVIVAKSEGVGEMFVPKGVTIKVCDSEEELAEFITSEELIELVEQESI